ncbi:LexA family transcriptional regulator [uncultured Acetatifactor sp.]|jgi:repressor LexA|uniref:LexA family protein n=1 Tax=uncultured Acetatifactor sp. TaxID=1671927 RepID=UPI0026298CE7|nr:XRE family transcriptional regulator [uncultured Acetatifactor sp.]
MADIGKRIKEKRESLGMTQEELAAKLGYKNKSSIAKIETGTNDIVQSKVVEFANILDTTVAYLMGWETIPKNSKRKGVVINVLGRVAAGVPIEAIENVIDTEEITEELARTGTFFGLQIHGNSMEPKMSEGDIVIVRQQDDAESGEIVIVTVNGTDATCKRLRKYRDGIELISNNPSYEPIFYTNEEIENKPVKIIGRVVELRAKF